MMFKHERWKQDCYIEAEEAVVYVSTTKEWIMGHINPFDSAIDAFKFLPIFLILAYAAFLLLVDRWRTFMVLCHTIQGMKSAFSSSVYIYIIQLLQPRL